MYNSIYPVNINYSNHNKYKNQSGSPAPLDVDENSSGNYAQNKNSNKFPNGAKVAIDYTKGNINISQVVADFKNTIIAINAPKDVSDDVNLYLSLVEKESFKDNPSKDIILSNLKNASKISDLYITQSLNKPSKVVEGWIDALFLQNINLKSNPKEVNPDFLLEFPEAAKKKIEDANSSSENKAFLTAISPASNNVKTDTETFDELKIANAALENKVEGENIKPEIAGVEAQIEVSNPYNVFDNEIIDDVEYPEEYVENTDTEVYVENSSSVFEPVTSADIMAKDLFIQAKLENDDNVGDTNRLNLLNEALGILSKNTDYNNNIKAAIHFERGKVFDEYDYVDYALRDYHEATKTEDYNLKAQAYYKSAKIYDEFSEFSPALDNYLSSVAYSGEAENYSAQSLALTCIAGLYADRFNAQKTDEFTTFALDSAKDSEDENVIAKTYSAAAQNYQYVGDNEKALDSYKNALKIFSNTNESFEQMAYNYEQAAIVMERLGNKAKARKLLEKANLYYRKSEQQLEMLEAVS